MKKRIIAGLVIAVAAGLPYATGYVAESETKKAIDDLNAQSAMYGALETVSYERGYNKTTSEYKWVMTPELEKELDLGEIIVSCEGAHKLVSYAYTCDLKSMGNHDEEIRAFFKGKSPVSIKGAVGITGSQSSETTINPIEIEDDGVKITSDGGIITSKANSSGSDVSANGNLSPILISGDNGAEGRIEESTITMDGSLYENKYFIGDMAFNFGDMTIKAPQLPESLSIKGVSILSETDIQKDLYSGKGTMSLAELTIPAVLNSKTNQDVSLKDVSFGMSFADIPFAPIAKIGEYMQTLSQEFSEISAGQATVEPEIDEAFMKEQLFKLSKKDLAINYWLRSKVNDGELNFNIKTALTEDITEEFVTEVETGGILAAMKLLQMVNLDIAVAIPNSVTQLSPEIAMVAAMSNKFVSDDSGLSLNATLKDGAITLNGEPTSIEGLMQ